MPHSHIVSLLLFVSAVAVAEPKESCERLRHSARFAALFDHVELEKLVQTVSDATCKTFILGENVKGKISIVGPEHGALTLSADEFYAAFLAALDANGLTVYSSGRFLRVVEKARGRTNPIPLGEAGAVTRDEMMTRVFRVRFVELEPARALLSQFLTPGGDLVPFAPDLLFASDLSGNLDRLTRLLATIDVERPSTETVRVLQVAHAEVMTVTDQLTRALTPKTPPKAGEGFTLVPDERTNRLVVVASPATLARVTSLLETLDVALPGDSRVHVYKLANAEAKEVAANLEVVATASKSKTATGVVTGEVKLSANESLNALLIVASAGDYRNLVPVIQALDAPRRQVFIETVIMEINATRDNKFGASMHFVPEAGGLPIAIGSQPEGAPSSLTLKSLATSSGLLLGTQGSILASLSKILGVDLPQFGIAIQALQSQSDVNVLSTPHILTTDNKEAVISVGQRIPFQSGVNPSQVSALLASGASSSIASYAGLASSVTRERVELKLTVKPHIGEGDSVRLEIDQQEEELAGENALGPITSTRSQKTAVVAHDSETVVLGGIMQDRVIESASKTPVLGDIPLLGNLFRFTKKEKIKVNLLVLLTPHIIREPADFQRVLQQKQREREHVLEQLYGEGLGHEPPIDFASKRGPLAAMSHALELERRRPENGGDGAPSEVLVRPATRTVTQ